MLKWAEREVWEIIERHGIVAHPAYHLGWGRLSCMCCIFGSANQWATIQAIYPERFEAIAEREEEFGVTIHRTCTVRQLAAAGRPYRAALAMPAHAALAMYTEWHTPVKWQPWLLPAGAYGESAGPT